MLFLGVRMENVRKATSWSVRPEGAALPGSGQEQKGRGCAPCRRVEQIEKKEQGGRSDADASWGEHRKDSSDAEIKKAPEAGFRGGMAYSHSMVDGGLEEMSYTTRLTPFTSLMMRPEILASRSAGRRAQSAVMASTLSTMRRAMTCS